MTKKKEPNILVGMDRDPDYAVSGLDVVYCTNGFCNWYLSLFFVGLWCVDV